MPDTKVDTPDPADADGESDRGGYLGYVAHEVRNPLSTALWSAELLARMSAEDRGGARGEKLTAMCLRSLGRVRQLVEDHFLCERLDARGIHMHPEPIALRALLEEIAGRRTLDLGVVELDVDEELIVHADRTLLERVLDALLAAAGKEGAAIHVSAHAKGGRTHIALLGHPPGPNSFEDPRKGSPGDPKGRSLALPLARRVADVLGGTLAVEGGALVLSLPHAPDEVARADPAAHP